VLCTTDLCSLDECGVHAALLLLLLQVLLPLLLLLPLLVLYFSYLKNKYMYDSPLLKLALKLALFLILPTTAKYAQKHWLQCFES
jgi:hypothetical protein